MDSVSALKSLRVAAGQRGTTGADVVRAEVLARIALGHSKRKIARDLHIGRHTIDAILARHQSAPLGTTRVARITPPGWIRPAS
jgi:DNA-binding CsgD family transcriptional regulator